ncbi:MAG: prolipoprotein diacylglyceryl transferase [Clostridia bacterium]
MYLFWQLISKISFDWLDIKISSNGRAIEFWGYPIYFYGIIIVAGICAAMIVMSRLLKRKGLLSDICLDYAVLVIPLAIIGARLYFLIFPYDYITSAQYFNQELITVGWSGEVTQAYYWSFKHIFAIRDGGLGIYGAVIAGYVAVYIITKVKKLNFLEIADCIIPGLFLAQSMGRWGNFINGEAHGNIITNPIWQWFPNAVEINGSFYQATFFYESMCTLLGFIICLLLLKNKHYRNGWCLTFYGLFYGAVRLVIEGLRTDSLFLRVPLIWKQQLWDTGIRISQAVSILVIVLAFIKIIVIYRKEILVLLKRIFHKKQAKN